MAFQREKRARALLYETETRNKSHLKCSPQEVTSKYQFNNQRKRNAIHKILLFFSSIGKTLARLLRYQNTQKHGARVRYILIFIPYFTILSTSNPIYSLLNNCSQCERCRFVLFRCIIDMFMSLKIETHSIRWLMIPITLREREDVSHRHTIIIHGCALTQQQHKQPKQ